MELRLKSSGSIPTPNAFRTSSIGYVYLDTLWTFKDV
jgi:hypothetical protein